MKFSKVESGDARLLVRSLGLLLNQAAVYGPVHNVTKSATARVYREVRENLDRYGVLEFSVKSNLICVNGSSDEVDSSISSNLVRRFAQLDISGLLLSLPMPPREFEKIVRILAMPIAQVAESEGVGGLFAAENIRSASVVKVNYRRVESGGEESDEAVTLLDTAVSAAADAGDSGAAVRPPAVAAQRSGGVIDLSEDLLSDGLPLSGFGLSASDEKRAAEQLDRKRQSARLADLLRQTAESLEENTEHNPKVELGRVIGALERVRSQLLEMSRGSESAISTLAREVDADKLAVAGMEADARRRGCPLKLTREELLERYAELNQELLQPLTVSTGVIEMMRKEQAGEVSETQRELLRMAHESIERVNQLVHYMHGVSGLPTDFNPNAALITDSYQPFVPVNPLAE
jgi:hypothetical protein